MNDSGSPTAARPAGWLVIWTESRAEKKVASRMAALGLEAWVPTVTERRRWSDRWREVVLPLFPGYLFVRDGLAILPSLLRTPGVLTVVKTGDKPAVLQEQFVVSLRQAVESAGAAATAVSAPHDYAVDDEVIVREGPLAGFRGVVRQLRGARHLVIWIEAIGRGVAFAIGEALLARPSGRAGA